MALTRGQHGRLHSSCAFDPVMGEWFQLTQDGRHTQAAICVFESFAAIAYGELAKATVMHSTENRPLIVFIVHQTDVLAPGSCTEMDGRPTYSWAWFPDDHAYGPRVRRVLAGVMPNGLIKYRDHSKVPFERGLQCPQKQFHPRKFD